MLSLHLASHAFARCAPAVTLSMAAGKPELPVMRALELASVQALDTWWPQQCAVTMQLRHGDIPSGILGIAAPPYAIHDVPDLPRPTHQFDHVGLVRRNIGSKPRVIVLERVRRQMRVPHGHLD